MRDVDTEERISISRLTETISKMSVKEQQERVLSLFRNINTLLESIGNLMDEEKELVCIYQIGFVGNLSALTVPDMIRTELGSAKGCKRITDEYRKG